MSEELVSAGRQVVAHAIFGAQLIATLVFSIGQIALV